MPNEPQPTRTIKDTVNLPQTEFPIRAGLVTKEPEILELWQKNKIYDKSKAQQKTFTKSYILHDGPPYPNGDIHLGHALNKILKDIVVRSKTMAGFKSPYIPGWDCHGLPIETQVLKTLSATEKEEIKKDIPKFRALCKEFALNYVELQKKEFIRLGIWGEWDNPYLTLNPSYEAKIVELFGAIAEQGLIYRGKRPIHWCPTCETALAEAEIEYADHKSPSVYVKFKIQKMAEKLQNQVQNQPCSIIVWTTTPWTLPANVAIVAHPELTYTVFEVNNEYFVVMQSLYETIKEKLNWPQANIIGTLLGKELTGTIAIHPFIDRESPILMGHHVTAEDGTGFVHTAPGHGMDDYLMGIEYHLPMIMPVDEKGKFTSEVPQWAGMPVFEANKPITQFMESQGSLLKLEWITHSYPHCWRCKKPVIFRATEQWFIAMDKPMNLDQKTLREKALTQITKTKWYPDWGEKRIRAMVENRPDWCISRQRFWGLPLPIVTCAKCGHPEMTGEFNKAIIELVQKEGSSAWFSKPVSEILPTHLKCSKCGAKEFKKETDILDVWFESGSSFGGVLEISEGHSVPAQLYLEGSDQHRGWFQSSLLVGIGARNKSPYESVLTHGFLTDDKGHKMSKSLGNVVNPQEVTKDFGADILRWWAASSDFKNNDVSISPSILNQSRDAYSKTRNTIRFLLSNLYDFEVDTNGSHEGEALVCPRHTGAPSSPKCGSTCCISYEDMNELDQWILAKLYQLNTEVVEAYYSFEFHLVTYKIHEFCAVTLSSLYLDMVKDRLYCDGKTSKNRQSTQTAIYIILESLLKLLAPVLVFTAEDAYSYFKSTQNVGAGFTSALESIHLAGFPKLDPKFNNQPLTQKFDELLKIREQVYQKLEPLRNEKTIRSFLESTVSITLPKLIEFTDWESFLIVSQVTVKKGEQLEIAVEKTTTQKCERCWKYQEINENKLCARCAEIVNIF